MNSFGSACLKDNIERTDQLRPDVAVCRDRIYK